MNIIISLQKQNKAYYSASTAPEIVGIGKLNYLSIPGNGSPGTDIFYGKKKAIIDFIDHLQTQLKGTEKTFKSDIVELFY